MPGGTGCESDTITYSYDELGRVTTRAINGVGVTWSFDALGRVTSEVNALGTFTYAYDGPTDRIASVAYPNGQTSDYSYYPNSQAHRLQTIHHKYPNTATLSKFADCLIHQLGCPQEYAELSICVLIGAVLILIAFITRLTLIVITQRLGQL